MVYLGAFLVSLIINDGRIINRTLGDYVTYIKYKAVYQELGIVAFLGCLTVNFAKGFVFLKLCPGYSAVFLLLALLLGNYLGAKPGSTGASPLMIVAGAWAGLDLAIIQIPLAVALGWWLINRQLNQSLGLGSILVCLNSILLGYNQMALASLAILAYYTIKDQSLFSTLKNRIEGSYSFM